MASGSNRSNIHLWKATSGRLWKVLKGHSGPVYSVTFSPDGTRIASASKDRTVRLWDASSGVQLLCFEGHFDIVYAVAFSPNSGMIAFGSAACSIRFCNLISGEPAGVLEGHSDHVSSVAYSPSGTCIASGSHDMTVRLWDVNTMKECQVLNCHTKRVYSVAFSPNGSIIASASWDRSIRLWDVASGTHICTLEGHSDAVMSLAFSPDGTRIASGSDDKTVRLWIVDYDVTSLRSSMPSSLSLRASSPSSILRSFSIHDSPIKSDESIGSISSTATLRLFSPDATIVAATSRDDTGLSLWDTATGRHLFTLARSVSWSQISDLVFSGDGSRIAATLKNDIQLWDTRSGRALKVLQYHDSNVLSSKFSSDGTKIASIAENGKVCLWDAINGLTVHTLHTALVDKGVLAFSPNGTHIAITSHKSDAIIIWDTISAKTREIRLGYNWRYQGDCQKSIEFSPNGRYLVLAMHDTLNLLELVHGHVVRSIGWNHDSLALWMPFMEEYTDPETKGNSSRRWADVADQGTIFYYFIQDGWIWLAHPRRRLCWVPIESRPSPERLISSKFRIAWNTKIGGSVIIDFSEMFDQTAGTDRFEVTI